MEDKLNFYSKNDIIEMAVKMEQNGYSFYNEGLRKKNLDPQVLELLTKLRDDEKLHEKTFQALRDKIDELDLKDSTDWEEVKFYIEMLVGTHVFSDQESAIKLAQKAEKSSDLLNYAIQFEKDTLLFFHSIRNYSKGEKVVKIVNAIINEEVSHIEKLSKLVEMI